MGKIKRYLITFPVILIILIALFLVFSKRLFNIDLGISLFSDSERTTSVAVLRDVREICSFNTIEYIYKIVFPLDFLPEDVAREVLADKQRKGVTLNPAEMVYLEVYDLCREIGIDTASKRGDFVVVTSVVKGGYDFTGTVFEDPESAVNLNDTVRINKEENSLVIRLPDPVIADCIIEDATSENYPYPDIAINPEGWKKLTSFLSEKIKELVIEDGILVRADEKGKEFLERFFLDAGFSKVIFLQEENI